MARGLSWGDIRLVEFGRPDKTRPALVLGRSRLLDALNSVTVAPITSTVRGNRSEVVVGVDEGLKHPAAVKLDALRNIDKRRIGRFLGSVSPHRAVELRRAVLFALQLDTDDDLDS